MLKWGSRRETESEQGVGGDDLTRNHVSYPWPESSACDRASRLAPTSVAKLGEELWIGVKCQPNVEIAGSPRNACRCSRLGERRGGRALERLGAKCCVPTPTNRRMARRVPGECGGGGSAASHARQQ